MRQPTTDQAVTHLTELEERMRFAAPAIYRTQETLTSGWSTGPPMPSGGSRTSL